MSVVDLSKDSNEINIDNNLIGAVKSDKPFSVLSIISLVVTIVGCCCTWIGGIIGIVDIILNNETKNTTLSIVSIVLSFVLSLGYIFILFTMIFAS